MQERYTQTGNEKTLKNYLKFVKKQLINKTFVFMTGVCLQFLGCFFIVFFLILTKVFCFIQTHTLLFQ